MTNYGGGIIAGSDNGQYRLTNDGVQVLIGHEIGGIKLQTTRLPGEIGPKQKIKMPVFINKMALTAMKNLRLPEDLARQFFAMAVWQKIL